MPELKLPTSNKFSASMNFASLARCSGKAPGDASASRGNSIITVFISQPFGKNLCSVVHARPKTVVCPFAVTAVSLAG
ncbi:MAG TPA: hypothetical protein PL117_12615 [Accumulibacter sp.]|uniref:hypothetical protein n=1 Tax=Accumulibacter sp. TaxID=2053492 RepID=UPI002C693593|nr:hypothetical protein [Accumulibacter sp.]HRF73608.1 hypothetical protein [Accumulibacter sp.]